MASVTRLISFLALGLAVFAGGSTLTGAGGLAVSLAPDELLSGATVPAGGAYPITVTLAGDPETAYDVAATYEGGIGACASDSATVTTDAAGAGSWVCEFTASATPGAGAVTFSVSQSGSEIGYIRGLLTVEAASAPAPVEQPEPEPESEKGGTEGARADNHGGCVSYWAKRAKAEGLSGKFKGAFVSWIAKSDCTTSTREDEAYTAKLAEALAAQAAATEAATATKEVKPKRKKSN